MKTLYSPLKRNEKEFFEYITNLIDLLEKNEVPSLNEKCNDCLFIIKQKEILKNEQ